MPIIGEFVRRHDAQLLLGDDTWRFVGANIYWLMQRAGTGESGRRDVQRILDRASRMGLTVIRTWAFGEGAAGSLHPYKGESSEAAFAGLDFVVAEAARRGLRLVLPIVNYWNDYGGVRVLQQWCIGGAYARGWKPVDTTCPRFYTDQRCHDLYLRHARELANRVNKFTGVRYADDPTIMMWELCNECRCRDMGTPQADSPLRQWVRHVAPAVKRLVPNQLLSVGGDGFYDVRRAQDNPRPDRGDTNWFTHEGGDVHADSAGAAIDVVGYHCHPSQWIPENGVDQQRGFVTTWVRSHESIGQILHKPVIMGEFSTTLEGADRDRWYAQVLRAVRHAPGHAGVMFWQLTLEDVNCCVSALVPGRSEDAALLATVAQEAAAMAESGRTRHPPPPSPAPVLPSLPSLRPVRLSPPSPPLRLPPPDITKPSPTPAQPPPCWPSLPPSPPVQVPWPPTPAMGAAFRSSDSTSGARSSGSMTRRDDVNGAQIEAAGPRFISPLSEVALALLFLVGFILVRALRLESEESHADGTGSPATTTPKKLRRLRASADRQRSPAGGCAARHRQLSTTEELDDVDDARPNAGAQ